MEMSLTKEKKTVSKCADGWRYHSNVGRKIKNEFVKHRNVVSQKETIELRGSLEMYHRNDKNACIQRQQ